MSVASTEINMCAGLIKPTPSESVCRDAGCRYNSHTGKCMEHLDLGNSILILPEGKTSCISKGFVWNYEDKICQSGYDLRGIGPGGNDEVNLSEKNIVEDIADQWANRTPTQKQELNILIVVFIFSGVIIFLLINASVKKTKAIYKSSSIPLKNKVKRKELETRLSELEDVKPAEQTYVKTSYEDETEEINEVKKLERQIKIKKLKKELKELEAEED